MAVVVTILLGALVGWLASKVMNRDAEQGWVANILVGVAGALVGTFIFSLFTGNGTSPFIDLSVGSVLVAFLGALVVSGIVNYVQYKKVR